MKKNQPLQKLILVISVSLISFFCFAQVTQEWVVRYNGSGNSVDIPRGMAVDATGNVYVTGESVVGGSSGNDMVTIKYNPGGSNIWIRNYSLLPGTEVGYAVAVDAAGNVYVTGSGTNPSTGLSDFVTIKYNASGSQLWVRRYSGAGGSNDAKAIVLDLSGNVYITGGSSATATNTSYDYATIKYDTDGNLKWIRRFSWVAGGDDISRSLGVDPFENVYVTGWSASATGSSWGLYDYATIKYDKDGNVKWVRRYDGPGSEMDQPLFMVVDSLGNSYVSGKSAGSGTGFDFATIKYNTNGVQQWVRRYNGPANSDDQGAQVGLDKWLNVYVTGTSNGAGTGMDHTTIKYNPLGVMQWVQRYNGPANGNDVGNFLFTDAARDVYVVGTSQGIGTDYDLATIKYNTSGTMQWIQRYNGPANAYEAAQSFAGDASGNIYVTGRSTGTGTGLDYATIKYSQPAARAARSVMTKPADLDMPTKFHISNYPNPVSSTTKIQYELPYDGQVSVKVYDVLGREVATLVNANMKAGYHSTDFNAVSHQTGVYYYKIIVNTETKVFNESKKILVVK